MCVCLFILQNEDLSGLFVNFLGTKAALKVADSRFMDYRFVLEDYRGLSLS